MKKEDEKKLQTTEMRMIRWMCGVSLKDRNTNEELRNRVGVEDIGTVCRKGRLRWFGHVERKSDDDWVKKCSHWEKFSRKRGRPKLTWKVVVKNDMKVAGVVERDAEDRAKWKKAIRSFKPANRD